MAERLSVDGLYSHIAWLRTIKEKIDWKGMKNMEIMFPLIDDVGMNVAQMYGMIQPAFTSLSSLPAASNFLPQTVQV